MLKKVVKKEEVLRSAAFPSNSSTGVKTSSLQITNHVVYSNVI